jgi:hypothetical protein
VREPQLPQVEEAARWPAAGRAAALVLQHASG